MLKMDKQEETQRFLGGIKNKTREERIEFLEKKANRFNEGHAGQLTVCLKDGTPIGITSLSIRENDNNAELSYLYDLDYTNKGYCSEASKKLLEVAFKELDLHKVFADTVNKNTNSIKVLERLNFKHEGTRREAAYDKENNTYMDFLDYGILKDEYKD
jgi:RimJ/RimL family protein N-acetyltransferase